MWQKNEQERKPIKEVEKLNPGERNAYFNSLREECRVRAVRKQTSRFIVNSIGRIASIIRKYELNIEGDENIPDDENVIFLCNHSNAHDMFSVLEIFLRVGRCVKPMVAWDGLSWFSRLFFRLGDSILIERGNKKSIERGIKNICSEVLRGKDGLIFAEGTWNIHPTRPMQYFHAGVSELALITGKKVVPTILEYIETDKICKKETEIYKRVVVSFGQPVTISAEKSIFSFCS